MLFAPSDRPRKFEKASEGKTGAQILDFEDSVVAEEKNEARQLTQTMLSKQRGPQQLYVPVNALDRAMPATPDGILLPKSRGGNDVRTLSSGSIHSKLRPLPSQGRPESLSWQRRQPLPCRPRHLEGQFHQACWSDVGYRRPLRLARRHRKGLRRCIPQSLPACARPDRRGSRRDRDRLYRHRQSGGPRTRDSLRTTRRLFGIGSMVT
ncbi:aldolase/citrate lyase family protein [Bradyrhizobium elkanii]|nr:aldolase/citrate lyase family protein [Bradyrhizobium elkanii]WLA86997.1 aldolase/citrate lyase family protein [Bradyrhizobium elkanii]